MNASKRGVSISILVCVSALLWSCGPPNSSEVSVVPAEKAKMLWETAETREPVGEPIVNEFPNEDGVIVLCRQAFRLGFSGRPSLIAVRCCTGSCSRTQNEDGTQDECVTSGCRTGGETCTDLKCSGGCELGQKCVPCPEPVVIALLPV